MSEQITPQNQDPQSAADAEEISTQELEEVSGGADTNTNCFAICGSKPNP